MHGFYNKILIVDLTARTSRAEALSDAVLAETLGGKGLATRLLLEHAPAGVDPLSPENPLVFAVGPVTDTRIPGSCRYGIFTKSPQTGFYSESYSGGKAAEKMSRSGFDAVVVKGAGAEPLYLEISEEGARFHDAADLWGKETYAAEDALLAAYGGVTKAAALVIGPAGERQVPFSIVANDYWRCAGRTGAGAVMGSKKLKALVYRGEAKRPLADPGGIEAYARKMLAEKKDHAATQTYKNFGTPVMVNLLNTFGAFPTRYWHEGRKEGFEAINAESMKSRCDVRPKACARCFMACGKLTTVKQGRHAGLALEGPEYETIYAFGGLCLVDSIEEIVYLNDVCDRLGIDTISAGNLVAFAMEASAQGRISEAVPYGDVDVAAGLLADIAARRGLGEVLSKGIVEAGRAWGMERQTIHVKGLEPAGYDPRILKGMGLAYATSDRGACHLRTTFYKPELSNQIAPDAVEGKAALLVDFEDRLNLFDGLILCRFFRDFYPWEELAAVIRLTTGQDLDRQGLKRLADTIADGARRFNLREGLTKDDDWLPDRFFDEPLPEKGNVLTRDELARLRADYYAARGWDAEGRLPT
ncbi:MAG: aldehyde ferredoxin oxidoreductase family protein [Deltaproteobacteria bacterium]|nr:aldehyde ferredoxin oxidoreductase family protein [Deltaproteobacteria bacterium]